MGAGRAGWAGFAACPPTPAQPYIALWNEQTGAEEGRIVHHERGIIALAFSPDGKYLASIGEDDSHTMAIWNWEETKSASPGVGACYDRRLTAPSQRPRRARTSRSLRRW